MFVCSTRVCVFGSSGRVADVATFALLSRGTSTSCARLCVRTANPHKTPARNVSRIESARHRGIHPSWQAPIYRKLGFLQLFGGHPHLHSLLPDAYHGLLINRD